MVGIINYLSGNLILILALIRMKVSVSFLLKLTIIKNKVIFLNEKKEKLPKILIISILEIEDKRYFQHKGIDVYSILRAIFKNITSNRIEGASTITQQMVRNITNDREIKITRKISELMLATLINKMYSKNEILVTYLETYLFNNCVGIINFCENEKYDIESLSINECAQISGRLKYPNLNRGNYIKYLKRVRTIEIKTTNHISMLKKNKKTHRHF
jgi:membrane carboxypeptidase/penicillin-binding protein